MSTSIYTFALITGVVCILSEAITNHLAAGKLKAYSAGSQPAGQVHPLSLRYLDEKGISLEGLSSQSWDNYEDIQPDIVVTVCDSAANETCPVWFGDTVKIHWGLPDPSKLEGTEEEIRTEFYSVMATIEERVKQLLALDLMNLSKQQLQESLDKLSSE